MTATIKLTKKRRAALTVLLDGPKAPSTIDHRHCFLLGAMKREAGLATYDKTTGTWSITEAGRAALAHPK